MNLMQKKKAGLLPRYEESRMEIYYNTYRNKKKIRSKRKKSAKLSRKANR